MREVREGVMSGRIVVPEGMLDAAICRVTWADREAVGKVYRGGL